MKFAEIIDGLKEGIAYRRYNKAEFWDKVIVMQIPQTVPEEVVPKMTSLPESVKKAVGRVGCGGTITYHDQVLVMTMNGNKPVSATSYVPSWEDIFADDWEQAF